jgi:hypothetical protein
LDIAVAAGYTDPYFVAAVSGAWLHLELEKHAQVSYERVVSSLLLCAAFVFALTRAAAAEFWDDTIDNRTGIRF